MTTNDIPCIPKILSRVACRCIWLKRINRQASHITLIRTVRYFRDAWCYPEQKFTRPRKKEPKVIWSAGDDSAWFDLREIRIKTRIQKRSCIHGSSGGGRGTLEIEFRRRKRRAARAFLARAYRSRGCDRWNVTPFLRHGRDTAVASYVGVEMRGREGGGGRGEGARPRASRFPFARRTKWCNGRAALHMCANYARTMRGWPRIDERSRSIFLDR